MSQTGGLSTFLPLIALTSSGSSAVPGEACSTTASPTALQRTAVSCLRLGPARADLPRKREVDGSESGGHAVAIGAGSEVLQRSRTGKGVAALGRGGDDLACLAWQVGSAAQATENRKGM